MNSKGENKKVTITGMDAIAADPELNEFVGFLANELHVGYENGRFDFSNNHKLLHKLLKKSGMKKSHFKKYIGKC